MVIYTNGKEALVGPIQSEMELLSLYFTKGGKRKRENYERRVITVESLSSIISDGSLYHLSSTERKAG